MTVWCFVSDVHGNARALEKVERVAGQLGVDRFVSLGDIIGRGGATECVEWVLDHAAIALQGNRDRDLIELVGPELRERVAAWPREAAASDFVLTHGDPGGHKVL